MTNKTNILSALGLIGTMIRESLAAPSNTTTDVISVNNRTEEEISTKLVVLEIATMLAVVGIIGSAIFTCFYLRGKGFCDSKDDPLQRLPDCNKNASIQIFLCEGEREEYEQNDPERLSISTQSTDHVHDDNYDNLSSISEARYALNEEVHMMGDTQ